MRAASVGLYWLTGLLGVAAWTVFIIGVTSLPLPVELALGAMALVACAWGHAVLFPKERLAVRPTSPGRTAHDAALQALGGSRIPVGEPRRVVSRPQRNPAAQIPPGELPPLLRVPFEEAARMEARRLGEALTAAGLFGPVAVRIDADGTALVAPVRENEGVRMPAEAVVRFAAYVMQPEGLAAEGRAGQGQWPGRDLAAAIEAHLNAAMPAEPATARVPGPRRLPPGWIAVRGPDLSRA